MNTFETIMGDDLHVIVNNSNVCVFICYFTCIYRFFLICRVINNNQIF